MKVLVTGANGYVGNRIVKKLSENGIDVKTLSLSGCDYNFDITDYSNFANFESNFDAIIHLAALILPHESFNRPFDYFKANTFGTLNILEFARKNNSKVILASTSKIYGKENKPVFKESMLSLNPDSPYGTSKLLAEELCASYSKVYKLSTIVLRLFNIYGPDQKADLLIPTILSQINNEEIMLKGNLNSKRDFIFVDDVAEAFFKALSSEKGVFNIGTGKASSALDIIKFISEILGKEIKVSSKGVLEGSFETDEEIADVSKAKETLGWEAKISLKEGLNRIVNIK